MKTIAIVGAYIWGALYATGVFVAALAWGDRFAVLAILTSACAAYLSQCGTAVVVDESVSYGVRLPLSFATIGVWAVAIIAGAAAGLHLLGAI